MIFTVLGTSSGQGTDGLYSFHTVASVLNSISLAIENGLVADSVQVSDRDRMQDLLKVAGIPTAVHYPIPLNRQPAVKDDTTRLPVGDAIAERVMSLPMHPYLDEAAQVLIVSSLEGSLRA